MDDINVEAAFDAVARAALRRGEQDDDLYVFLLAVVLSVDCACVAEERGTDRKVLLCYVPFVLILLSLLSLSCCLCEVYLAILWKLTESPWRISVLVRRGNGKVETT